jgi:uncharacterized membrane protein
MKTAIKYGLSITLVVVLWVLVTHFIFPLAPDSKANTLGPILFNLAAIVAIYLGIKARAADSEVSFKRGNKSRRRDLAGVCHLLQSLLLHHVSFGWSKVDGQ